MTREEAIQLLADEVYTTLAFLESGMSIWPNSSGHNELKKAMENYENQNKEAGAGTQVTEEG
jgi:hypothetical protein